MVDSVVRGGTRFTIHLPLADKGVVLPQPPAKVLDCHADVGLPESVSLIIVDDESIVRLWLTSMLRKLGVKAHAFERGADAVAFVREFSLKQACIALVDLMMPEMDGPEVIRQLRDTGRQVSCVLMSGHADDYVKECARQLNPDRVLSKPFMMSEVREVVAELIAEMRLAT
ncbi:MAG: CheY-like chemotaxis protein [Planctomycetota bacterium]|jgi:CheY-like chemotaxis protein